MFHQLRKRFQIHNAASSCAFAKGKPQSKVWKKQSSIKSKKIANTFMAKTTIDSN